MALSMEKVPWHSMHTTRLAWAVATSGCRRLRGLSGAPKIPGVAMDCGGGASVRGGPVLLREGPPV